MMTMTTTTTPSKLKRAVLQRHASTDEGTFGTLTLSDGQQLYSVELPWRDNATQKSCIPVGLYRCEEIKSPRFGRVYQVMNVPGRTAILIHAGNYGGDKALGWDSDLLGCIAPAMKLGMLNSRIDGRAQRAGISSRAALERLHAWSSFMPFELEVR
jgi:hypothetical protein